MLLKSPAKLWSDAIVSSGIRSVYRYTYGTRTAIPFISERRRTDYPCIKVQYLPSCSPSPIWGRGTAQKVSHPCSVFHNNDFFFTMIVIPLPFRSAHSFRNIQQVDGHLFGSRVLAQPPDCIRKLCQKSVHVASASLAPVRTRGFGESLYSHAC